MAFFSSQDNLMLAQEGNDTNCFVSLVVDTRGQYVARITRKIQTKSEVTVKNLGKSYEFFGEGAKEIEKDDSISTKVVSKDIIEYYDLDVERHEVSNPLAFLDDRFNEICRKKQQQSINNTSWLKSSEHSYKELSLFDDTNEAEEAISTIPKLEWYENIHHTDWEPDSNDIHKIVVNIISCSLIINPDKFDLKQWVKKHMKNVYSRLFKDAHSSQFVEWRDFILQYGLDHFEGLSVPANIELEEAYSKVSIAVYEEIYKYYEDNKDNPYLKAYCVELEKLINYG